LRRYCLWILGNAATLINSDSVWRNVVLDAKRRDCFHNAVEDKNLARAINDVLFEIKLLEGSKSPFMKLSLGEKSEVTTTSSSRLVEPILSIILIAMFIVPNSNGKNQVSSGAILLVLFIEFGAELFVLVVIIFVV
jgi:hypothetical protein